MLSVGVSLMLIYDKWLCSEQFSLELSTLSSVTYLFQLLCLLALVVGCHWPIFTETV